MLSRLKILQGVKLTEVLPISIKPTNSIYARCLRPGTHYHHARPRLLPMTHSIYSRRTLARQIAILQR